METDLLIKLLDKYINGDCTEGEVLIVEMWYQSFENDHITDLSYEEENNVEERIYNQILFNITQHKKGQ